MVSFMEDIFFDYFLKSLHFHLGDSCAPAEFISFNKNDYHAFIGIENHMLETLTLLMNILGKEGIVFSCGLMHQEKKHYWSRGLS